MRTFRIDLKEEFPFLGDDGKNPFIDAFLPYNMSEMHRESLKRPTVVICPGGGYGMVSQREGEPVAAHFLPLGFNVFVLNYSVAPHRYPSQLNEVAATFELIYKNADEWNCNTEKIFIMGFSAGGHLAAHYSNSYACDEVRANFPDSKRPFATILGYPVISADPAVYHRGSFINLYGKAPATEEELNKFSCDRLVTENTPPAFIWSTAEDNCVPIKSSFLYAEALINAKIPVELHIYPYGWHGMATVDNQTNDNLPANCAHAAGWLDSLKSWLSLYI